MISEETYHLVRDSFQCVAQQPIQVKGISYDVQAYDVLSPVSGNTRSLQSEHCQIRLDIDNLTESERSAVKAFFAELEGGL